MENLLQKSVRQAGSWISTSQIEGGLPNILSLASTVGADEVVRWMFGEINYLGVYPGVCLGAYDGHITIGIFGLVTDKNGHKDYWGGLFKSEVVQYCAEEEFGLTGQ
eukprot:5726176-Ditylum_brightwellii.AAC.1